MQPTKPHTVTQPLPAAQLAKMAQEYDNRIPYPVKTPRRYHG